MVKNPHPHGVNHEPSVLTSPSPLNVDRSAVFCDSTHMTPRLGFSTLAALAALSCSNAASAQDAPGATVGGIAAASNIDSRTELSFAGAFGYRFSHVVGFELEATVVPTLKSASPSSRVVIQSSSGTIVTSVSQTSALAYTSLQIYPGPTLSDYGGRAVIFSSNVRVDIPTTSTRLTPYFVAGGGVAHVRRTATFTYTSPLALAPTPVPLPIPRSTIVEPIESSATDLALTVGGGLGVGLASHVSLDVDLRYFRLVGDQDQNMGRFGVGVRYRF